MAFAAPKLGWPGNINSGHQYHLFRVPSARRSRGMKARGGFTPIRTRMAFTTPKPGWCAKSAKTMAK